MSRHETREGWINRYLFLALAPISVLAIVGLALWQLNNSKQEDEPVEAKAANPGISRPLATPTQSVPAVTRMHRLGERYASLGSHDLCYPDGTKPWPKRGYVYCSPYHVDHFDLVELLTGPEQGVDGSWYWRIQVVRGSMMAEVGEDEPPGIWWVADSPNLFIPIAEEAYPLVEPQPEPIPGVTYWMNWGYKLRSWPAGATIRGWKGPELYAGGGQRVTFTGEVGLGISEETSITWWCQLATLSGSTIAEYLEHLSSADQAFGAWVPCEYTQE